MSMLLESQVYWRLLGMAQQVSTVDQVRLFDWICSLLPGALNTAALDALNNLVSNYSSLGWTPFDSRCFLTSSEYSGIAACTLTLSAGTGLAFGAAWKTFASCYVRSFLAF